MKAVMREQYKEYRRKMDPERKAAFDAAIRKRVTSLWQYKRNDLLLAYVSTPIEVDTHGIIRTALEDGKCVAVPAVSRGPGRWNFTASKAWKTWCRGPSGCWNRSRIRIFL